MNRSLVILFGLLGAVTGGFGLVGCQPGGRSPTSSSGTTVSKKSIQIAVVPKGTSHEFWRSVHAGAVQAAHDLGDVEVIWKGPQTEDDTKGQIDVVKNFITKRVDAICLAPNHSQALIDVVSEANAEGIPVVVFDSGLGEGAEIVSYVATNNYHGGQLAGQHLAESIGEQGEVILLRYRAGSESTEQREKGFLDAVAKYPKIQVLSSDQYGGTTTKEAMDTTVQLLSKYRNQVDGIFAVCEPNCNGVLAALQETGLAGKVKYLAFDPSDGLINGLAQGTVTGIVLQDPYEMGRQSVLAAVQAVRGQTPRREISTGEYVATAENMKTSPFDRLLDPPQLEK